MSKLKIKDLNTVANVYQIPTTGTGATITGSLEGDVIVIDGNSSAYTIKASGSKVTISGINDFGKKFTVTVTFDKSKAAVAQTAKFAFADGTVELGYNPTTKTVTSGGTPVGKASVGVSTLPVDNTVTADSFEGSDGSAPALGKTFTLTTGVDNIAGTTANDLIDARFDALDQFDSVNGGDGKDTLIANDAVDFTNVRGVEVLSTTSRFVALDQKAVAAGIQQVDLKTVGGKGDDANFVNAVAFASALTVNGTDGSDAVFVDVNAAGNKTLNLGKGDDGVGVAAKPDAADGSVEVRFVSANVGNGTNNNVQIIGASSTVTVNDEGTIISAFAAAGVEVAPSIANILKVQGINEDGSVAANQNRGNFSVVYLGTETKNEVETVDFETQGNVYINAGAGDDEIGLFVGENQRHFAVGGAGDDVIDIENEGGIAVAIDGAGDDTINVSGGEGIEQITLISGNNTVAYVGGTLTLNTAPDALGNSFNDTLTGGSGRDVLQAGESTLRDIQKAAVAANQSISGFEEVSVAGGLNGKLTLSNIQAGLDTVTLNDGVDFENEEQPEIVFDAGVSGTIKLADDGFGEIETSVNAVECAPHNVLTVSTAGTGVADTVTIVNALAANEATKVSLDGEVIIPAQPATAKDAFNWLSINSTSVENLILNGTGLVSDGMKVAAAEGEQRVGLISLLGTSTGMNKTADTSVKFVGTSSFSVGQIDASSVDASGLTGTAALAVSTTARNVTGSAGDDSVRFNGVTNAAQPASNGNDAVPARSASLNVGAGDDEVVIAAGGQPITGLISVDAGAGNDEIEILFRGDASVSITAGSGDDFIDAGSQPLKTTDVINGGDGVDTLNIFADQLNASTISNTSDPLIVLRNITTSVENLLVTGPFTNGTQATTDDVFNVAGLNKKFAKVAFENDNSVNEVTTEVIEAVSGADLNVTAKGFTLKTGSTETVDSFGGDLKLVANSVDFAGTDIISTTFTAFANNVTLDVIANATEDKKIGAQLINAELVGAVKTATINLSSSIDTTIDLGESKVSDGTIIKSNNFASVSINAEKAVVDSDFEKLSDLTSVTLKGNGFASVQNEDGSKLATIDASGLNSVFGADYKLSQSDAGLVFGDFAELAFAAYGNVQFKAGDKALGLILESENASVVETVKLGGGLDIVLMDGGSTVAKTDTIEGLSLVLNANGSELDFAKSDVLLVSGFGAFGPDFRALTTDEKTAVNSLSLELTLQELQKLDDQALVFTNGGNTYVYVDTDNTGINGDVLVKLTGTINEAALLASLNGSGLDV